MGKKFVIVLFVATLFWLSTRTFGEVWRFDFGRQGDTPATDYVHVDSTTAYGYDAGTDWTYGVFGTVISEDYWGSWQTRNTPDELTLNGLRFDDDYGDYLSGFEVEVPNGEYLVTVGAGKVGWNCVGKIMVEGQFYSGTVNSENLYVLDVSPNNLPPDDPTHPNDSDGYLTWTLSQDYEMHAPMYYGQIQTWGYNNNNPYFAAAECLYLERQPVVVTDGKLTVQGMLIAEYFCLNFLEITPNTCQGVIDVGYRLKGDVNGDCKVNFMDFADLARQWLICNDPNDPSCMATW